MENNNINFTDDELRLIKGCLLTTKETFKLMPFKTNDVKNKILDIDKLLKKFN